MARRASAQGSFDLEVDVVAVGSGLGGVCAAIAARDRGAEVAILEKAEKLGGVSAYGGGEVFVPNNHKMREAGIADSDAAGRRYFEFLSAGFHSPAHLDRLLGTMHEAVEYMGERAGVRWLSVRQLPDYYYPHAPGSVAEGRYLSAELFPGAELGAWQKKSLLTPHVPPGVLHEDLYRMGGLARVTEWDYELIARRIEQDQRGFGPGLMGWFLKAALVDRKIPAFAGTPARELLADGEGTVLGVRATREGSDFRVRARRGVVLAVGGYDWNPEMARYFEGVPAWNSACPPTLHGDAIVLATEVGAALAAVPPTNLAMFFGYQIPGETSEGAPLFRTSWECGCPHAIWVNRAGRRFCDESFYKDYQPRLREWDGRRQTRDNWPPFLIFDQNYRERYPLGSFLPGQEIPAELAVVAERPRELAEQLGIDPEGLEATLARFNQHAARGQDPDFGRGEYPWCARLTGDFSYPNPNLAPLDKPPYYGVRLVPVGVGINSHGLKTDTSARVVHVRGHPIRGLCAVGNSAALLDLGGGYQSGTSNLRAITWGYVAGRHLTGAD